jgi:hypothetical protein
MSSCESWRWHSHYTALEGLRAGARYEYGHHKHFSVLLTRKACVLISSASIDLVMRVIKFTKVN